MNLLIIDQCSNEKAESQEETVFDAETLDAHSTAELAEKGGEKKARNRYQGRQQKYITEAVDRLQQKAGDNVDRYFISAGLGIVGDTEQIPSYDVTFNDYSQDELTQRASKLGIESDLTEIIENGEYDIVFFALGSTYYQTFSLEQVVEKIPSTTWVVCFNQGAVEDEFENVISLPARTQQAKELGTIVVALKGVYLRNFAQHRADGKEITELGDIKNYCEAGARQQSGLDEFDD